MELQELIVSYGTHDTEFKNLKKVCDAEKENLKNIMLEMGSEKESYGGYTVTRTVSERESFNEVQALGILKNDWNTHKSPADKCPYIKTIEVLDMEALENALYNGDISDNVIAELDKCRTVTEVVTLKCSKTKEKKAV